MSDMFQGYLGGGDPSRGGSIYRPGVKKWRYFYTFSAPKAPKMGFLRRRRRREKFLSTFFEIFGKFVNKNAIKSDFWGVVGRYISKISKKISQNDEKVVRLGISFGCQSDLIVLKIISIFEGLYRIIGGLFNEKYKFNFVESNLTYFF